MNEEHATNWEAVILDEPMKLTALLGGITTTTPIKIYERGVVKFRGSIMNFLANTKPADYTDKNVSKVKTNGEELVMYLVKGD